ncbi:hypothetical protein [Azospirillum sp. TSO35-2]|uniref:hypothetical protein n=1 Tax=Azospirillum sp. TSO35-2 TaxID=716796 RepID=UPI000D61BB57|nr:hypothetical protein [Azospirillum sp. TSO35-2]PWC37799.1 hypothetical protein TSO352_10000 [Azospirillum sp. TSO35-2]
MSVNTRLAAQAVSPPTAQAVSPAKATPRPGTPDEEAETFADRMSVGFEDLIDVVNPLQQLPVVSSIYREATGESISIPARLAGGFLFGGPAGLIGSAAMVAFEEITGDSVLGHLASLLDDAGTEGGTAVAQAATGTPTAPLPWLKADGADAEPSLPSVPSLAEALRRGTAATAATAPDASMATAPTTERPAPQLLAKLYSMEATTKAGSPGETRSRL